MDALSELISILNDNDTKDFKLFLKKKNKRSDVKNIELFSMIKTVDINKLKKLYGSDKNKDAYHSLRKRLHDNLILFLSNKTFEKNNTEANDALRLLVVSKFLLENNLYKPALKCLQKAEKTAEKLEQYSLLHEIFQTELQYAFLDNNKDIDLLCNKILKNQELLLKETRLNMAYAVLRQLFKNTQTNTQIINLNDLIVEISKKYNLSVTDFFNYKSIYQILYLANEYANIQQNFSLIAGFINKASAIINQQSAGNNQLYYHIHILYYLANFSFRSNLFIDSENYLKQMHSLMLQQNNLYYDLFKMRFTMLQSLNLHFTGNYADALNKINDQLNSLPKKVLAEDLIDLQLCHAFYLAKQNDQSALKVLSKLNHTDMWYEKKMGMVWTIRKNLMELLMQAQFNNFDFAISRLQSFKRRYKKYLTQVNEHRIVAFVEMIEKFLLKPEIINNNAFKEKIVLLKQQNENQDVFTLSFINWFIDLWEQPKQDL